MSPRFVLGKKKSQAKSKTWGGTPPSAYRVNGFLQYFSVPLQQSSIPEMTSSVPLQ